MRIGVVSDPHGCLVGLTAVVEWLGAQGVDYVVCAGDVANFGPQPNECIALLAASGIATVQGNSDRDLVLPASAVPPSDARTAQLQEINDWGRERLTTASRQWLLGLPKRLAPAPGLMVVHGGLDDHDEIIESTAQPRFAPGVSAVAAGHLHVPFIIRTPEGLWVNAGSAGRPCDGDPRAAAAILTRELSGWQASLHRVPFDLEAACQAIRQARMPYAQRLEETQRNACWW